MRANRFIPYVADDKEDALKIVKDILPPEKVVGIADSMSLHQNGFLTGSIQKILLGDLKFTIPSSGSQAVDLANFAVSLTNGFPQKFIWR